MIKSSTTYTPFQLRVRRLGKISIVSTDTVKRGFVTNPPTVHHSNDYRSDLVIRTSSSRLRPLFFLPLPLFLFITVIKRELPRVNVTRVLTKTITIHHHHHHHRKKVFQGDHKNSGTRDFNVPNSSLNPRLRTSHTLKPDQ